MAVEACKGCSASVRVGAASLQRLAESFKASHEGELAPEELSAVRLEKCLACPDLDYGCTCRHCGCLVQLRVLLKGSFCPRPGDSAWR